MTSGVDAFDEGFKESKCYVRRAWYLHTLITDLGLLACHDEFCVDIKMR